jgi:dephospho-CoA kinase
MNKERPAHPVIGLVGGIGSGKSQVAAMLAQAGCVVCDSDALVRMEYQDPAVIQEVVRWWGPGVQTAAGGLDRGAVAEIVFRDPTARGKLEAFIHPRVERRRQALFAAAPPGTPALVIDAPLLLEAGLGPSCTQVWFVDAPEAVRQARVQASRGWDAQELARREAAQWPLDRKRSAAHHVLRNDGDPASLRQQVLRALGDLTRRPVS